MKSKINTFLTIFILSAIPFFVSAQAQGVRVEFDNPIKVNSISELVQLILDIFIKLGAVVAVFMFVFTGFLFVKAQGKPAEIETAKRSLIYTAIGALILLGAKVISEIISNTVNQLTSSS